jgi:peptide deformylase
MVRDILIYPDPALSTPSEPIVSVDDAVYQHILDARDTMVAKGGVGIAGIQIGVPLQFFLMKGEDGKIEAAVNPSYKPSEATRSLMMEGCLSFPGDFEYIKRYKRILATYESFDIDSRSSEKLTVVLTGLKAHVFQHESEHLEGRTFISHLFPSEQRAVLHRMQRYAKKHR